MRLLVLYPNLSETKVPPHYIRLLAKDLAHAGHVVYGPGRPNYNMEYTIPYVVNSLGPFDAVLCLEQKYVRSWVLKIEKVTIPKAILLTDYVLFKNQVRIADEFLDKVQFDLLFHHTAIEGQNLKASNRGEDSIMLPFGVDTSYFKDLGINRTYDACAIWCDNPIAYPERLTIKELLHGSGLSVFAGRVLGIDYAMALNRSKICISSRTIYNNIQPRSMESTACGCMLLTDFATELDIQGWINGDHYILFDTPDDCMEKIKYYISNPKEMERIAQRGKSFVLENFGNEVLIKKIESGISQIIQGGFSKKHG